MHSKACAMKTKPESCALAALLIVTLGLAPSAAVRFYDPFFDPFFDPGPRAGALFDPFLDPNPRAGALAEDLADLANMLMQEMTQDILQVAQEEPPRRFWVSVIPRFQRGQLSDRGQHSTVATRQEQSRERAAVKQCDVEQCSALPNESPCQCTDRDDGAGCFCLFGRCLPFCEVSREGARCSGNCTDVDGCFCSRAQCRPFCEVAAEGSPCSYCESSKGTSPSPCACSGGKCREKDNWHGDL